MYISNVHIENFRNFTLIDVPLNPFSILIGKNDTGKSNLIDAINILLYNSGGNYYAKSLSKYDFNHKAVVKFQEDMQKVYENLNANFDADNYADAIMVNAPIVIIKLRFCDAKTVYEQSLLRGWLNGDEKEQHFEIEFKYHIKSREKVKSGIDELVKHNLIESCYANFELFLEYYDYDMISTNNGKTIDYTKIKNFVANTINAERDSFSSGDTSTSTRAIARIIDSSLDAKDRIDLIEKYNKFFDEIQGLGSFRSIYKDITNQNATIAEFIKEIKLAPNAKKYRDILENITLSYGNDMLFQRGLGTRNLILMLTLYSYFLSDKVRRYNMVCIEEPESHLDINSLKVALEFFKKSKDRNSLVQLLISTHSNQILNKLELSNVTLIANDHTAINMGDVDDDLTYYLAKRENFDTLNLLFSSSVILVEGATEEIYLNCLLQNKAINDIRVISIGQKGFKTFIEIWKRFHVEGTPDKLGVLRDYDNQDNAKAEHEAYNSDNIHVETTFGKEFESDFVNQGKNLSTLNRLFSKTFDNTDMYKYMTSQKLNCILIICKAIENGTMLEVPSYINTILEWIKA